MNGDMYTHILYIYIYVHIYEPIRLLVPLVDMEGNCVILTDLLGPELWL